MPATPTAYATNAGYSWEAVYTAGPNPQINISSGEYAPQIAFPTGDASALLAVYLKYTMPGGTSSFGALAIAPNAVGLSGPTPFTTTDQSGVSITIPIYLSALRIAAKSKTYVTSQGSGTVATGSGITQFSNVGARTTTVAISATSATQMTGIAYDPVTDRLIVAGSASGEVRLFLYDQAGDSISQIKAISISNTTAFASVAFSGDGTKIYWFISSGNTNGPNTNVPAVVTLDATTYATLSTVYPTTSSGSGGDTIVTFTNVAQSDKAILLFQGLVYEYSFGANTMTLLCSFSGDIAGATQSVMTNMTKVSSMQFLISGGGGKAVYRMTVPYPTTPTDDVPDDGCTEYVAAGFCDTGYTALGECSATYAAGGGLATPTAYKTGGGCNC